MFFVAFSGGPETPLKKPFYLEFSFDFGNEFFVFFYRKMKDCWGFGWKILPKCNWKSPIEKQKCVKKRKSLFSSFFSSNFYSLIDDWC